MLSENAKKAYLGCKFDNWDYLKGYSVPQLLKLYDELNLNVKWRQKPRKNQLVGVLLGLTLPEFMYLWDMGTGKTYTVLQVLAHRKKTDRLRRALILVKNVTNIYEWGGLIEHHTPQLSYCLLDGSSKERIRALKKTKAHLYVINYAGFTHLCCKKGLGKGRKANKLVLDMKRVSAFANFFDALVLDEAHCVKNPNSLIFSICDRMAARIRFRYGLTGTPMGRNPMDFWAQFKVIDRGVSFGPSFSVFREVFFWEQRRGRYKTYIFRKRMKDFFTERIKHRSIHYESHECTDMPKDVRIRIPIRMGKVAREAYGKIVGMMLDDRDNDRLRDNYFVRLRQICSGFIGMASDLGKVEFDFPANPKLDYLESFFDELPNDKKVVIFHEFIPSGHKISKLLSNLKIKHARLWSGVKDKGGELNRFKTDPSCRVMVANSGSGSTGLNLQIANYVLFYESPVSPSVRKQAEARVLRSGQQEDKVFIYDLVVEDSVEEKILEYIAEGKSLYNELINNKKAVLT